MVDKPTSPTGEVQFICTVPSDRVTWVLEQMYPPGDAVVVVASFDTDKIWANVIAVIAPGTEFPSGPSGPYFPVDWETAQTIGDLMEQPAPTALVAVSG